jgi:predicted RNA-binding protein with PIN domain
MPYLVDGHNLIPKLGFRLDSPDDELELVGVLQEFARLARREAEVFFDGAPAGEARTRKFGLIRAHFIRLGSTADAAIKARLKILGRAARNWSVVSSDHEVQNAARAAHASVVSSEEFARQLKALRSSSAGTEVEKQLSEQEVLEWLKFFGTKE